jgi:hypothetical protein
MKFAGQGESVGSAQCDEDLEAVVAGEVVEDARVVDIIFDDEENGVAFLQSCAIVFNRHDVRLVRYKTRDGKDQGGTLVLLSCGHCHGSGRRSDVGLRQVQG